MQNGHINGSTYQDKHSKISVHTTVTRSKTRNMANLWYNKYWPLIEQTI